jgi:hypothetical protein
MHYGELTVRETLDLSARFQSSGIRQGEWMLAWEGGWVGGGGSCLPPALTSRAATINARQRQQLPLPVSYLVQLLLRRLRRASSRWGSHPILR